MKNVNDETPLVTVRAVMRAECAHCGRLLGYRSCASQQAGKVTHGICLPFCQPMISAGWDRGIEQTLLDKRPWIHSRRIV